ncbi:MAG: glycosyltransferase [Verrucomicrobiota bacterium]
MPPTHSHTTPSIAFAAGWTAGHIVPAITLAHAWQNRFPNSNTHFFTGTFPWEQQILEQHGFPNTPINVLPWKNQSLARKLLCLARLPKNTRTAQHSLQTIAPKLVFSCGGFVSIPATLAAKKMGIPIVIFEPNAIFGAANQRLAPDAALIITSSLTPNPNSTVKTLAAGVPLPQSLLDQAQSHQTQFPKPNEPLNVLVTGGSLGSGFLNQNTPALTATLAKHLSHSLKITHLAGRKSDPQPILTEYQKLDLDAEVLPYHHQIEDAYAATHFAISSAGANSLHELAAFGIPTLIVPLAGAADDHQSSNARAFSNITKAPVTTEAEWSRDPAAASKPALTLLEDPARWTEAAQNMRAFPNLDATNKMIEALRDLIAQEYTPA